MRLAQQSARWALCWAAGFWPAAAGAQWVSAYSPVAEGLGQAITAHPSLGAGFAMGNPAGLVRVQVASVSMNLVQHAWVSQLSRASATLGLPLSGGQAVGVAVSTVGVADYRETLVGLSYARSIGPLSVGVRVGGLGLNVPEAGSRFIGQVDAGVLLTVDKRKRLTVGCRTANAHAAKVGREQPQTLPQLVAFGMAWQATEQVGITAEWQHRNDVTSALHAGLWYQPVSAFVIRLGAAPSLKRIHAGVGWKWRQLSADIATRVDPILGWTPSFGIEYRLTRSK